MPIPNGFRVIVAGAATGIGAATAKQLASQGAKVVVGDINLDGAKKTVEEITAAGGTATAVHFNLADDASCKALIDQGVEFLGGSLDGLANVAADLRPETMAQDKTVLEVDSEFLMNVLNTNLVGHARTTRYALPHLLKTGEEGGKAAIVNVSSAASYVGEPVRVAYAASKAGINALTRHTASAFTKRGVRTNCVAPGLIIPESDQPKSGSTLIGILQNSPAGRPGTPEETAATIVFLLSPEALYTSGQTLSVNGGFTFRD